jgi:RimJ/RimL family protein N-acetyltransferase
MISYEGDKVRLRPIRKADAERSIAWRNDPEVRENTLGYRFPVTEEMEAKWYESALKDQDKTRVVFAIEALADDALIGIIQLNRIDWIARLAYLGITIGERAYHGQGFGTDATKVLLRYAFDGLNLRKVCLEVVSYNTRAMKLYRALGFTEEGRLRDQVCLDGAYHDVALMALFADDFRHLDRKA